MMEVNFGEKNRHSVKAFAMRCLILSIPGSSNSDKQDEKQWVGSKKIRYCTMKEMSKKLGMIYKYIVEHRLCPLPDVKRLYIVEYGLSLLEEVRMRDIYNRGVSELSLHRVFL